MSIKVWIAPVLAALALGVISCTQPNQAAHSAGAQYVNLEKNGKFYFESKLGSEKAPNLYRYVDCDSRVVVYVTYDGGLSSQPFNNGPVEKKFCGE